MPDLNDRLRRYIDSLEEPVTVSETMDRRSVHRFLAPAAVLAGAAIVLLPALVLIGLRWLPRGGDEVAQTTTVAPATTNLPSTTTSAPQTTSTTQAPSVEVPDLDGLTVDQAEAVVGGLGLRVEVIEEYPSRSGFGLITAQDPMPGDQADSAGTITVGVNVRAECLDYEPDLDNARSTTVRVLFECAPDWTYPDVSTPVIRVEPIGAQDPIEATLRALLAGPTAEERAMGFSSWFSAESAGALNSVTLDGGRLTVDFNDAVLINNISTSTGGMFFMAELQANLFQFPEVDSIEFQRNGSCDGFWGMMESACRVVTRSEWDQRVAAWDAERELQPQPGAEPGVDDVAGKTFTTQSGDTSQRILRIDGTDTTYSGFTEVGGWPLDDAATGTFDNWALRVTGLNEEMIWLVEFVDRDDNGSMVYTVRSVLVIPWDEILPVMHGDPFLQDGAGACSRNGESDPQLIVAAETAQNADGTMAQYTTPLRAWLIDVEKGSFVEVPTDGIECLFDLS